MLIGFAAAAGLFLVASASAQVESRVTQAPTYRNRTECFVEGRVQTELNRHGSQGWRLVEINAARCSGGSTGRPGYDVILEK